MDRMGNLSSGAANLPGIGGIFGSGLGEGGGQSTQNRTDYPEAAPDGYTLYMPALATFVAPKTAAPNVPLHLPRDFIPIGFTAENPMFVAVNPSLGVNTLPELIAL